ncbi:hypothetical protein KSW81_001144 [Nannochloris sp. 'desiccata']|nr:hypothetical protein KSW81_001144 [Chlorella desiccata (nom. nud.)]
MPKPAFDALKKYARDLTEEAREGRLDPVIGRDDEIRRTIQSENGEIILFIDEMHTLVGAGKADGAMDASNLLKPALARGELHCVGATTLDEYRKHVEKDAALARRSSRSWSMSRMSRTRSRFLRGLKEKYEQHHKVDSKPEELDELDRRIMQLKIEREALKKETDAASADRLTRLETELTSLEKKPIALTARWQAEKQKLGLAADLKRQLDEARNELAIAQRQGEFQRAGELAYGVIPKLEKELVEAEAQDGSGAANMVQEVVTPDGIAHVVSRWTGIPVDKMLEGERDKLLRMEDDLAKSVVAHQVAGAFPLRRRDGHGPARHVGIHGETLGRPGLIGAPPGYVGYEEGGALTEAVLDDGRLTDGQGRTVDFKNTIIIMTSNLGADYLTSLGEDQDVDQVRDQVMDVVKASFRPEFLNRVDEIILFHRLRRSEMGAIVDIQMKRLLSLLSERKIRIDLAPDGPGLARRQGLRPCLWRATLEAG